MGLRRSGAESRCTGRQRQRRAAVARSRSPPVTSLILKYVQTANQHVVYVQPNQPLPHLCDEPAVHELPHPLGRQRPLGQRQLDFQHGVGEARDLGAVDGQRGVAVPAQPRVVFFTREGTLSERERVQERRTPSEMHSSGPSSRERRKHARGRRQTRPAPPPPPAHQRPAMAQEGCPSGFSLIMQRLVSRVKDTVRSWPICRQAEGSTRATWANARALAGCRTCSQACPRHRRPPDGAQAVRPLGHVRAPARPGLPPFIEGRGSAPGRRSACTACG